MAKDYMKRYTVSFWLLLVVVFAAKLIYIGWGPLDLVPDEAHYWDWSRHLDFSYYSKGPFIAYNIFLGTKLGEILNINPPNPAFWVRFPAIVNSTILGIIAWFLAVKLWKDRRSAFYIVLILTAIPIYAVGSFLMTIDNPLMLFWALYLYVVFLALETGKARYWCISGIVLGLGFLSKYAMIMVVPSLLVYLAVTRDHKYWLKRKEFYLGFIIAFILFLPVLIWNARYDWIGIRHLLGQAGVKKPFFSMHLFEFVGIQFGVVSPIIFILIIITFIKAWKLRNNYRYSFLFWMGIPLGIFYLILSLHEYCQANWPAPVYLAGSLLAGKFFCGKRILMIGAGIGIFMWLLIFCIDLFPNIPSELDPTIRLRGWKKLGLEMGNIRDNFLKEGRLFIFSDTYQITSELAFYIPGHPVTFCVNTGRRMNQYDLWQGFSNLLGYNAIYVKHRDQDMDKKFFSSFKSWKKLSLIDIKKGEKVIHQYSVFLCRGFKGKEENKDEITY